MDNSQEINQSKSFGGRIDSKQLYDAKGAKKSKSPKAKEINLMHGQATIGEKNLT